MQRKSLDWGFLLLLNQFDGWELVNCKYLFVKSQANYENEMFHLIYLTGYPQH